MKTNQDDRDQRPQDQSNREAESLKGHLNENADLHQQPSHQPMGGQSGSAQGNDTSKMKHKVPFDDENSNEEGEDPTGDRPRYSSDEDAEDEDTEKGDVTYPGKD